MKQTQIKAQALDQTIRNIAQREREALGELIFHLRELDSFRGYEALGFTSLFDYLTKGVGYSAGAAQRRIDAARLSKDVPELSEKLKSGQIDLHHVATVSKAIRQIRKNRIISKEEKRNVVNRIQMQTEAQTQQLVANFFDLPVITETKRTVQKDDSVRLEITVSREVAQLIEKAQGLVSHAVPTKDLASFLEYLSRKIVKQKSEPAKTQKRSNSTNAQNATDFVQKDPDLFNQEVTQKMGFAKDEIKKTVSRPMAVNANLNQLGRPTVKRLSESQRRKVRNQQPACMRCGSIWFLQTDHKTSRWVGGKDELVNLQTLCGPCNRIKYRKESGVRPRVENSMFV